MDWLKCNICFNQYNDFSLRPRTLSCGHTFCEVCLDNTVHSEILTCPQCRKLHEVKSAKDLPINFTLEGLLKSLNQSTQDVNKGLPDTFSDDSSADGKCKILLKSYFEKQVRGPLTQIEQLKTSAGKCIEHQEKELIKRCCLHNSWVCEKCIEEQGHHPRSKCKIITFTEEIVNRKREQKSYLNIDVKLCNEALSATKSHISYLTDEKNDHTKLINMLQDLIAMHKKEEKSLQTNINSFQKIVEMGENVKHELLDVVATISKAQSVSESNAARDMIKTKNAETQSWVNSSQTEIDESKNKVERSSHLAMATRMCIENIDMCRLLQEDHGVSEPMINLARIKSRNIQFTRKILNKTYYQHKEKLGDDASKCFTKVQLILFKLFNNISEEDTENSTLVVKRHGYNSASVGKHTILDTGSILLHSMQAIYRLPKMTITLPYDDLELCSPPLVLFTLTHKGTMLGSIVIQLDILAHPGHVKQFTELVLGCPDRGGYKGGGFNGGLCLDSISCSGHINVEGKEVISTSLVNRGELLDELMDQISNHRIGLNNDTENYQPTNQPTKGAVYQSTTAIIGSSSFSICMHDDSPITIFPIIGHVIQGMPLLKEISELPGTVLATNVFFSDCGMVIDNTCNI